MRKKQHVLFLVFLSFLFAGCTDPQLDSIKQGDYEQTKQLIVDVLQTDDGKKALQDAMTDKEFKQQLIIEDEFVKQTLSETLLSKKGQAMWKTLFQDAQFVKSFQKATEEAQKDTFKKMLHDAQLQKEMIKHLQDPQLAKPLLTLFESQQYREQLEKVLLETVENPLFQVKLQEALQEGAKQQDQEKDLKDNSEEENDPEEEDEDDEEDEEATM